MDAGVKARWIRCSTGLDQRSFAEAVGVSRKTIGALERGEREPYRSTIDLLAAYLEMPGDELEAFLYGKDRLVTIPASMRKWFMPPITSRMAKRTLSDLQMLLDEAREKR